MNFLAGAKWKEGGILGKVDVFKVDQAVNTSKKYYGQVAFKRDPIVEKSLHATKSFFSCGMGRRVFRRVNTSPKARPTRATLRAFGPTRTRPAPTAPTTPTVPA